MLHLLQVVVNAITSCMLYRLAGTRKILFMQSLVRYESFIQIFMHYYIKGILSLFCNPLYSNNFCVNPETLLGSFSISTRIAYPIIATLVYKISMSYFLRNSPPQRQKWQILISIQAWIHYVPAMPQQIEEKGSFGFSFQKNLP